MGWFICWLRLTCPQVCQLLLFSSPLGSLLCPHRPPAQPAAEHGAVRHLSIFLPSWHPLAPFVSAGPLTNLKQSMVQLQRPRRLFDAGSFGLGGALSTRFRPVEKAGGREALCSASSSLFQPRDCSEQRAVHPLLPRANSRRGSGASTSLAAQQRAERHSRSNLPACTCLLRQPQV